MKIMKKIFILVCILILLFFGTEYITHYILKSNNNNNNNIEKVDLSDIKINGVSLDKDSIIMGMFALLCFY